MALRFTTTTRNNCIWLINSRTPATLPIKFYIKYLHMMDYRISKSNHDILDIRISLMQL